MKLGFIDYYLDEWHALNYPQWISEQSHGEISVAYATATINGSSIGKRDNKEVAKRLGLQWIDDIETLIGCSDGLIVLSPDNPEQHVSLAQQALASGKPVYIDKTFAPDLASAKSMFEMAQKYNTPMYSTSALRYAKDYVALQDENLLSLQIRGPLTVENYAIHQIEPMLMLMGSDVTDVMHYGAQDHPSFLLRWADGRTSSITFTDHNLPFSALAFPENEAPISLDLNDNHFLPFIDDMIDFFRTTEVKITASQTCANIAVLETLKVAQSHVGRWINVEK